MHARLAKLRQQLQQYQQPDRPRAARYPAALRQEIGQLAQEAHASGTSFAAFARRLGVTPTLVLRARPPVDERRARKPAGAVRPVIVTPGEGPRPPRAAPIVTLPSGMQIEGLGLSEIVALARALP
jgi:transposase-like protein